MPTTHPSRTGIALREVPLMEGRCDYLLMLDRAAVGIIEAKKEGVLLSGVAEQSAFYAGQLPPFLQAQAKLRFFYESTGVETFFRDTRDPEARSRRVFAFHQPETLAKWLSEADTLRARLRKLPPLITTGMRDCQIEAITGLEQSFAAGPARARSSRWPPAPARPTPPAPSPIGSSSTPARAASSSSWTAPISATRPRGEFQQFVTPDTGRKFTELYNVQHLTSNHLD